MHILAFQSGLHDASAAAFEDYRLVAAVAEERLRREKGWGNDVPWLAIDEVLGIAGWTRRDVDAIATIRGVFPLHYFRLSPAREFYYKARKLLGRERRRRDLSDVCTRKRTFTIRRFRGSIDRRDLSHICTRNRTSDESRFFRTAQFLATNGFRPETSIFFANHHAAHALAALFYTDWDDALIYTSDGIGDNVSYSMRGLKGGKLACHYGDDRWLTRTLNETGLASAYGYATVACGFRMLRHEGKLTGLAAYGEPKLASEMAAQFRFN